MFDLNLRFVHSTYY